MCKKVNVKEIDDTTDRGIGTHTSIGSKQSGTERNPLVSPEDSFLILPTQDIETIIFVQLYRNSLGKT